jgi:hypothetical protein
MKIFLGLLVIPVLLAGFFIVSCGQDSIFFDLSNEPVPKPPLIPGSPTNMTLVRNQLFVGSRMSNRIFRYGALGGWSTMLVPDGGSLGELATDGKDLYVLVFPEGDPHKSTAIKRYNLDLGSWDADYSVRNYYLQSLYGVEGNIFAGALLNSNYQSFTIFYLNPSSSSLVSIRNRISLLRGAAKDQSGTIYLATAANGVFRFSNGVLDANPVRGTAGASMAGIIETGGNIVAVSYNGSIYYGGITGFENLTTGVNYTGAMGIWLDRNDQWKPSLLLMGIRGRGTSLTHGYQEMVLNNGRPTTIIRSPGDDNPTSIVNRAKYTASIGLHPVESILQLPDVSKGGPLNYNAFSGDPAWEPPIFASTSKNGLWSYRNGEWNAEN